MVAKDWLVGATGVAAVVLGMVTLAQRGRAYRKPRDMSGTARGRRRRAAIEKRKKEKEVKPEPKKERPPLKDDVREGSQIIAIPRKTGWRDADGCSTGPFKDGVPDLPYFCHLGYPNRKGWPQNLRMARTVKPPSKLCYWSGGFGPSTGGPLNGVWASIGYNWWENTVYATGVAAKHGVTTEEEFFGLLSGTGKDGKGREHLIDPKKECPVCHEIQKLTWDEMVDDLYAEQDDFVTCRRWWPYSLKGKQDNKLQKAGVTHMRDNKSLKAEPRFIVYGRWSNSEKKAFNRDTCEQWIYNMMVANTLRGMASEQKLKRAINKEFGDKYYADYANSYFDKEYKVDILIWKRDEMKKAREKHGENWKQKCNPHMGVQMKTPLFFKMKDYLKRACKKHEKLFLKEKIPTYFFQYVINDRCKVEFMRGEMERLKELLDKPKGERPWPGEHCRKSNLNDTRKKRRYGGKYEGMTKKDIAEDKAFNPPYTDF